MSVHEMTTAQGRQVTVGWDAPLSTYWGQVDPEADAPTVWVGSTPHEVGTPEQLAEAMREHAEISQELQEQLTADEHAEGALFGGGDFDVMLYKMNVDLPEVTDAQREAMAEALRQQGRL